MDAINIPATTCTPEIRFDEGRSVLSLEGESYPENAFEFFAPVLSWVERRLEANAAGLTLEVRLNYLNTSSVKCLIDILDMMEDAHARACPVRLTWYCDVENESARELAEEFGEDVTFPFFIEDDGESS